MALSIVLHWHDDEITAKRMRAADSIELVKANPDPNTNDHVTLYLSDQGWSDLLGLCIERSVSRIGGAATAELVRSITATAFASQAVSS